MVFEIRPTQASDADALRSIRLAALGADPTAFGSSLERESIFPVETWIDRAAGNEASRTFVAVDGDGSFVGMAGGHRPTTDGPIELVSMWTAPSARGHGVGRALVDAVVAWATELGDDEVRLWVTRGNDTALRLYERCGFVLTDEVGVAASDPCREELRMVRST